MERLIHVSTWNVHGALGDDARCVPVLNEIDRNAASIVALPDSWHEDSEQSEPTDRTLLATQEVFHQHDYVPLYSTFYDGRPDDNYARYGFTTLIRKNTKIVDHEPLHLGERPADHLLVRLGNHTLNVISLYLDDQSEAARATQVNDLLEYLEPYDTFPTILLGDFNAMHGDSLVAKTLRTPLSRAALGRTSFRNATGPRLVEMADGGVMRSLEDAGFRDVDPRREPTMPSSIPLFQLDHILVRDGEEARLFASLPVHKKLPDLSDHVAVSSSIRVIEK